MWHRDMKREIAVGKMAPIDLLDAGLPQNCKKTKRLWSTIKQSAIKWDMSVFVCGILIFDCLKFFLDNPFITFGSLITAHRKQNKKIESPAVSEKASF